MKFFSEKYNFNLQMFSEPCRLSEENTTGCPGSIDDCEAIKSIKDCDRSGGTTMTVQFYPADRILSKTPGEN
jgi:hypothetical protein